MRPHLVLVALMSALCFSSAALADEAPAPAMPGRMLVHANLALNVYTHLGALGEKPSADFTPASRLTIFQQVGVGYFLNPHLRVQLTLQFGETLRGLSPNTSAFALAGAIPWAVFVQKQFWIGAGPLFAARSSSVTHFDAGIFAATGYAFPLGAGFTLSPVLQCVTLMYQRFSFAITPAASLAYRF